MSLRPATTTEIKAWNQWLQLSHGLKEIPGASIYHLDIDCPMLLTPLVNLDDLSIRLDRHTQQPIMTFRLYGDVRTIAGFWAIPKAARMSFALLHFQFLRSALIESVAEGRLWWGTEFPPQRPMNTSFFWWFTKTFPLPHAVKQSLRIDLPSVPLETSLDLA
jgi:hypothetical protein